MKEREGLLLTYGEVAKKRRTSKRYLVEVQRHWNRYTKPIISDKYEAFWCLYVANYNAEAALETLDIDPYVPFCSGIGRLENKYKN